MGERCPPTLCLGCDCDGAWRKFDYQEEDRSNDAVTTTKHTTISQAAEEMAQRHAEQEENLKLARQVRDRMLIALLPIRAHQ